MLKEFKNGNLHLRIEKDDKGIDVIEKMYFNYDFYPVGEGYYLNNYTYAEDWCYNGGSNYYRIDSWDLYNLENGKTVILYPLEDKYVNEYILNDAEE